MLTFDSQNHVYKWNDKIVPSVTQVLTKVGAIDATWFTPEAAERGKNVHSACELMELGTLDWLSVTDEIRGYLSAYELFLKESKWASTEIEKPLYSESIGIAGTPDRIGKLQGRTTILDIKSGAYQKWWELQIGGYSILKFGDVPVNLVSLELRADGSYRLRCYEKSMECKMTFRACVSVYNFLRK